MDHEMFEALKRTAHESIRANEGVRQAMDVALRAPEKPGTLREAVERLEARLMDLARALRDEARRTLRLT